MSYADYNDEEPTRPQFMPEEKLKTEKDKDELIANIRSILHGERNKENEDRLFSLVQLHRTLVLDIATQAYIAKPGNSKLLDSINTILAQTEKSARDDRKERAKDRELEDNRANFATFVNALNEVASGRLEIPNYGNMAIVLDPLAPIIQPNGDYSMEIKNEELHQGHQHLDAKEIEQTFDIDDEPVIRVDDEGRDEEFDPEM